MLLLFCLPRWSQLSILFPYTTLFRSERTIEPWEEVGMPALQLVMHGGEADDLAHPALTRWIQTVEPDLLGRQGEPRSVGDRKSTRLNSSHTVISYAVFCLKKKTLNRA